MLKQIIYTEVESYLTTLFDAENSKTALQKLSHIARMDLMNK